tara:strand:+ start:405 stop:608 length:204 start_codon:yes stop_codon:yes gene_type:complete
MRELAEVVGMMGDGINDSNALHAADAGSTANTRLKIAKHSADLIWWERNCPRWSSAELLRKNFLRNM